MAKNELKLTITARGGESIERLLKAFSETLTLEEKEQFLKVMKQKLKELKTEE